MWLQFLLQLFLAHLVSLEVVIAINGRPPNTLAMRDLAHRHCAQAPEAEAETSKPTPHRPDAFTTPGRASVR